MSINYAQALKRYLNQEAVLKKCTGHDEYGKAMYSEDEVIKVREVPMQKLVVDEYGKQVVSKTTILTNADVKVNDLIDNRVVIGVEWGVDRFGRNISLQAFIRE